MRNNKKKGFTLVELLVVIAILAILATVSVVTYTSYIENTTVRVDEDLAVQLNNFLGTVKVDINGEHYEDLSKNGVTADNVMEITNYIKSTGGLESITPKAAKYGYHFYFDLVEQKYVLIKDDDDRINSQSRFGILVHGLSSTQTAHPELAIAKEARYFLVETGTDLANLVAEFKTITTADELNTYYNKVSAYETDTKEKLTGLIDLVKATVFTTDNGHFIVSGTTNHKHLFVQNDLVVTNKNNHEKMSLGAASVIITKDAPLVALQKDQTIVLSLADGVTLAKHSFWFADGSKATLVINGINTIEDLAKRVDIDFTNANVVVGGVTYSMGTNGAILNADGTTAATIEEKNKVTSFSYTVSNDTASKVDFNNGFIAIDGGTFTLSADNFTGLLNNEVSTKEVRWTITSVYYEVEEEGEDGTKVKVRKEYTPTEYASFLSTPANGQSSTFTITIGDSVPALDGIVIEANSVIGTETSAQTFTLKVLRATGVTGLALGNNAITFGSELNVYNGTETTVDDVTTTSNTPYTLNTNYSLVYNYSDSTSVTLNAIAPVMSGAATTSFDFTNDGKTLTLKSSKTELLDAENITVTFGKYFSNTFKVSMYDALHLTFLKDNDKVVVVGDENPITIGELIKLNDGFSVPDSAQIWFMKDFGTQYAKPGEIPASSFAVGYAPDDDANLDESKQDSLLKIELENDDKWDETSIQFVNTKGATTKAGAQIITVVIVVPDASSSTGYRCISQPRSVALVDGVNIREYTATTTDGDELTSVISSNELSKSVVLLNDIAMSGDINYFTIGSGKTFYGNTFDFDIKNGRQKEEGIINLQGRIQDVKITGMVYPTFASTVSDTYGSSAIMATGNSYIYNCYISNTRSPLRVGKDATLTVENTVLFGGRYANIDMTHTCTVTIKGTVTTVQQKYSVAKADNNNVAASNIIGVGLAGWFSDDVNTIELADANSHLVQYNFMRKDDSQYLPTIEVAGSEIIDLSLPFKNIFEEKKSADSTELKYGSYLYTSGSTQYANSGAVATDKYMLKYTVTGDPTKSSIGYYFYQSGVATKTVTAVNKVAANASITINYNKSYWNCTTVTDSDGSVTVTGQQFNDGVVFKCVYTGDSYGGILSDKVYGLDQKGSDRTNYGFQVTAGNDYKTVVLNGSIADLYNNLDYTYDTDLSSAMATADAALGIAGSSMYAKGIHYCKMLIDVYTPKSTSTAVKVGETTYTYQQLLDHYIEMTDGDGTNDNIYTPEVFEFDADGTINNYWE